MKIRLALLIIILAAVFAGAQKLTTTQPTVVCDTTTITNCANVTAGALTVGGSVALSGTSNVSVTNTPTVNQGTPPWTVAQNAATSTTTTMQNAAVALGNGTVLNTDGMAVAVLTETCTGTCNLAFTLTAQNDAATFVPVYGIQTATNTIASAFTVNSTTASQIVVPLHGQKQLRAGITTYTSGTVTITGTTSAAAGNPPPVTNAIISNPGAIANNITQLAGQPIDTNSGGLSAGTLRFVMSTAQPNLTTPLNVSLGALNSNMNIAQIGGTNTTAVSAAPNAKLQVAMFDSTGLPINAVTNPCDGTLTTLVSGSITADTQIIGTAGAGIKRYYCSIAINNGGASNENVSIVESTTGGGTCTTAPSAVWGSTTDANGWLVTSGGGGFISETLKAGPLTNAATCIKVNTGGLQIDYVITYVQQ